MKRGVVNHATRSLYVKKTAKWQADNKSEKEEKNQDQGHETRGGPNKRSKSSILSDAQGEGGGPSERGSKVGDIAKGRSLLNEKQQNRILAGVKNQSSGR